MSYILDALRRAEAERERGAVPGLHSQPLAAAAPAAAGSRNGPWLAAGAGGAVLLLGAVWWWMSPPPAPVVAPPAPVAAAPMPPPVVTAPAPPAPPPVVAAAPAPRPAPKPAPAAPAEPRIVPFAQLGDEVRRSLPTLAIGGAIYSESAASRMLIVGGQLLHEGDNAAPGIVLERIKPHSAVLRRGELRYEIAF